MRQITGSNGTGSAVGAGGSVVGSGSGVVGSGAGVVGRVRRRRRRRRPAQASSDQGPAQASCRIRVRRRRRRRVRHGSVVGSGAGGAVVGSGTGVRVGGSVVGSGTGSVVGSGSVVGRFPAGVPDPPVPCAGSDGAASVPPGVVPAATAPSLPADPAAGRAVGRPAGGRRRYLEPGRGGELVRRLPGAGFKAPQRSLCAARGAGRSSCCTNARRSRATRIRGGRH